MFSSTSVGLMRHRIAFSKSSIFLFLCICMLLVVCCGSFLKLYCCWGDKVLVQALKNVFIVFGTHNDRDDGEI